MVIDMYTLESRLDNKSFYKIIKKNYLIDSIEKNQ